MKKIRVLCLLLALVMCLGLFAACGPENDVIDDGGDRTGDSWEGVNFQGQEVHFRISTNQARESTFPAADIYTKGPDVADSNEVTTKVLARNARVSSEIGINIQYSESHVDYDGVLEEVQQLVQNADETSPDLYNNDFTTLSYAMIEGLLWNVNNPGEGVKSYFDFEKDCWYTEYIKGCTFDQSKLYMFVGDYFIDIIRMAWVIYVNNDLFTANKDKMPAWCKDLSTFYSYVADGFWDFDMLNDISNRAYVDSGTQGVTEKTDDIVGLAVNHTTDWVFSAASGETLYYQDVENGYKPCVMESIDVYQRVANKFVALQDSPGVYWETDVISSTKCFLQGNFLFAVSRLGEMESTALREFQAAKGLVPLPKWDSDEQDDYHTPVHNQVEGGSILKCARAFSAASALMQFLNEESKEVVHAYYDKGLKYKYNDDEDARMMMDLIRDTTDSPFGFYIGERSQKLYTGATPLVGMYIENNTTCSSTFSSERSAYVDCLNKMVEKFKGLN